MKNFKILTLCIFIFFSCENENLIKEKPNEKSLNPIEVGRLHNKLLKEYIKTYEIAGLKKTTDKITFKELEKNLYSIASKYVVIPDSKKVKSEGLNPLNATNKELIDDFFRREKISNYMHKELLALSKLNKEQGLLYINSNFAENVSKSELGLKNTIIEVYNASYQFWTHEYQTDKRIKKEGMIDDDAAVVVADCIGTIISPIGSALFSIATIYVSKDKEKNIEPEYHIKK
ncbi:MAG: hypothetical protein N4A49_07285 [Marinifilaceae bacterium]|jgi:hypothetical protein|nr:hypothetical protein [Marinifilaceae bacterium]